MITKQKVERFIASDDSEHNTLEDAQEFELANTLAKDSADCPEFNRDHLRALISCSEDVVEILSATGKKRRVRKKIGRPVGSRNKSKAPSRVDTAALDLEEDP